MIGQSNTKHGNCGYTFYLEATKVNTVNSFRDFLNKCKDKQSSYYSIANRTLNNKLKTGTKQLGTSSPVIGQSNTKQWTRKLGTKENDYGDSVTTDSSGNIYVTGLTRGLDGNTGMSGLYDIILMKFDSSGTKQWTKQLVTSNRQYDQGSKSFFDSSGNIYVTGWTPGFSSGIDSDIILIKFNSSGTKQWTKKFGTSSIEIGLGGTTDSSGNIYVTGYTRGDLEDIAAVEYDDNIKSGIEYRRGVGLFGKWRRKPGETYVGERKDGKYHGQGTLTYSYDDQYRGEFKGEFKDGEYHGQGTFTNPDGTKYVGEFKDGEYHGQGTLTYHNGSVYVGRFNVGNRNGQGTFTSPDGEKYVGEWNEKGVREKSFQGTYTFHDGNKYEGEYKDGKYHGQGTLTYHNGSVYVGRFKDGYRYGQGTFTSPDGEKYVREWNEKGVRETSFQGTGTFPDGSKYIGEFKDGEYHGQGTYTWSNGRKYVGEYKNGSKWKGEFYHEEGHIIKKIVNGNTNSGWDDIFLVKFNSSGTKQWTKQLGTSTTEYGRGPTTDSSGNIYVTGFTRGGLDGNTNLGSSDIFLIKYNSSGTKIWTKQLGTSKHEDAYQVTTDSTGHIYMTGYTAGDLYGNTNSGSRDIFLIKFNSSGTKIWTKQLGTSKGEEGFEVTIDSSGNIYVTGSTRGGLDGNTNSGKSDIFLVKYNSSGTKQWTKQLGTSSKDIGLGLTTDSTGHIYMTGTTEGGLDGNANSGGIRCYRRASCKDIFLVKYNSSGIKQWTKQ